MFDWYIDKVVATSYVVWYCSLQPSWPPLWSIWDAWTWCACQSDANRLIRALSKSIQNGFGWFTVLWCDESLSCDLFNQRGQLGCGLSWLYKKSIEYKVYRHIQSGEVQTSQFPHNLPSKYNCRLQHHLMTKCIEHWVAGALQIWLSFDTLVPHYKGDNCVNLLCCRARRSPNLHMRDEISRLKCEGMIAGYKCRPTPR